MFVIPFHNIDPVIFRINSALSLNWYGLSYLLGVVFVVWQGDRMAAARNKEFPERFFYNGMLWMMLGIVIGGRLGDVLFYNFSYYLAHPLEIIATWKGGMSFHGGLIGVLVVAYLYGKKQGVNFLSIMDIGAVNAPIALLSGRIANFINGELYGRPSDVGWAIPFPRGAGIPRHPSQLYEGFLEGLLLFVVLRIAYKYMSCRRGVVMSLFLVGYGCARFVAEYFREPESLSWFTSSTISGGQVLSIPMVVIGVALAVYFYNKAEKKRHTAAL